jgi:hypothetical protein
MRKLINGFLINRIRIRIKEKRIRIRTHEIIITSTFIEAQLSNQLFYFIYSFIYFSFKWKEIHGKNLNGEYC